MRNLFWNILAWFVTRRVITCFIIKSALDRPYHHIGEYMQRWWLTPRFLLTRDKDGYLIPYPWLPKILKCRLHWTKLPDQERHLHNHPCENTSVILCGGYEESVLSSGFDWVFTRKKGDVIHRNATDYHALVNVTQAGCFSLWFMGKEVNNWGFSVDGKHINAKDYLNPPKK